MANHDKLVKLSSLHIHTSHMKANHEKSTKVIRHDDNLIAESKHEDLPYRFINYLSFY